MFRWLTNVIWISIASIIYLTLAIRQGVNRRVPFTCHSLLSFCSLWNSRQSSGLTIKTKEAFKAITNLKGRGTKGRRWLLNFLRDFGTRQILHFYVIPARLHNSLTGTPYMLMKSTYLRFPLLKQDLLKDEQSWASEDHHTQEFRPQSKFLKAKRQ